MSILKEVQLQDLKTYFPIFKNNHDMIFLDSAASAMKPSCVIDGIKNFYENNYSNIHRGTYKTSEVSGEMVDAARYTIARFINAHSDNEIIFTRGCTDSINKIALLLFHNNLIKSTSNVYITDVDHHSNILPWRYIARKMSANLYKIPFNVDMTIDVERLQKMFALNKPDIVSFSALSNVTGIIQNVENITKIAHDYGAVVILDCAQSIVHLKHDVQKINCDFMAFSMHKLYGPNGVGVLYGCEQLLNNLYPIDFGGDMVDSVSIDDFAISKSPEKFEPGTINIADIIGSKFAIDFVNSIGFDYIKSHDAELVKYSFEKLKELKAINFIGDFNNSINRSGLISFYFDNISSFDVGIMLGQKNICVRTGFHCAEPLHNLYCSGNQSIRISFGIYNNKNDIDIFIDNLKNILRILS